MSITSSSSPIATERTAGSAAATFPTTGPRRAAAGAWEPVEFHTAAGARLAVARKGRGPAVVCLHATGHGARDFEPFADRVAAGFEILAVDWPGQGLSPREAAPASAERYSQILEELIPSLTKQPAIVVGCSIGGAAAIALAARRKDLVRALVLCDPGGLAGLDAVARFFIGRMTAFFAAGARGARWFPWAFSKYYGFVLPGAPARAQRERIVASSLEIAPVLAEAWASFGRPSADLRGLAPQVTCPTLFAWAKHDRVLPWERCRQAATTFPDHRLELFEAGHAAFLEDPDRFAAVFREFVGNLDSDVADSAVWTNVPSKGGEARSDS